ncbi:MAG: SDR family oxidoreductase [Propionibacteriaceae bacterium]|nr:SDR family oxidoreductase [Micropruina sp.]HBX81071.1 short-chain dehydrogenase [Propionibacteriaceae bacterium]HBY24709.1 short-chain dehydrogenase [Propionibacteriaceae bacterium]
MTAPEFDGLVAVVTGGASGIGLATAEELSARGAKVAVVDLAPGVLPEGLQGFAADITSRDQVDRAVNAIVAWGGGLDILINNAGIPAVGTVEANDEAEWARVFDVNVFGTVRMSAAALPHLRRSRSACIVNVCSIAALSGMPDRALYSATKGAVYSLTLAMATDHVHEGVRVNCVSPGTVHTPFVDRNLARADDPAAELAALNARQAIGRMVAPEEVASAVAYLASPQQGSTTGVALNVDGGFTNLRLRPPVTTTRVAMADESDAS